MKIIQATTQQAFFDEMMIRGSVFVDEQKVPSAIEIDPDDRTASHFVAYTDQGEPASCLRLVFKDTKVKIGRVATLPKFRGQGLAKALMLHIETLPEVQAKEQIYLDAQLSALSFYQKLGYRIEGDVLEEAGILHQTVSKQTCPQVKD